MIHDGCVLTALTSNIQTNEKFTTTQMPSISKEKFAIE